MTTITDMFRSVNAVPTLSLNNVIGHELFGEVGSLITISNIIGESITSDISDYGLAVHSKVSNATYEGDFSTGEGGTYFPSKDDGITPRSSKTKWVDADAEYLLDSGIRRMFIVTIINANIAGTPTAINITDWVVSKEEWDDLIIETAATTLYAGNFKNNSFYFSEGNNVVENVGTKYKNSTATVTGDTVMESLIKSWITQDGSGNVTADYRVQNTEDMEIMFYYQAVRDMDVRVERQNIDRVTKNATLTNNQKDSKLELQRYGKALKSQINRVGNDSYEVTFRYNEATPFVLPKINDYISEGYKIIKMHFIARKLSVDVMVKLVKNSSILNPFTAINRSISPFTITKRNILSCFVYNEYFEISTVSRTDDGLITTLGRKALLSALKWNATYDTPIYNAQFISASSSSVRLDMSATRSPLGQSLVFNAQFLEPKIAGYQLEADGITGHKLTPVAYTDVYGQVDTFTMSWYNDLVTTADTHPVGALNTNALIGSQTYSVGLNPNESLALSFHEHLITDKSNIIIGDYFAQNNSLIKKLSSSPGITLIKYSGTVQFNIYDKVARTGSTGSGTFSIDSAYKEMTISSVSAGETFALVETASPHRLYLAVNYDGTDIRTLYFNDLEDRPNTETL